jgi:uncharacterized protein YjeT (DUF2065 family)
MAGHVRWIAFAVVALVVAGLVALIAPQAMPGAASAEKRAAEAALRARIPDCTRNPYFEKFRGIGSDWQFLRATTDGGKIEFNPFTIECNPQTGERDVSVQITNKRPDTYRIEDATTIQTITFNRVRYRYRIDCINRRFALLQQQWMSDAPEQVAHEEKMAGANEMRPVEDGGIGSALVGPTCSTGRI